MIKLDKTVKKGMLHRSLCPLDDETFIKKYPTQYQLDIMRKAILGIPNMKEELVKIENERYFDCKDTAWQEN